MDSTQLDKSVSDGFAVLTPSLIKVVSQLIQNYKLCKSEHKEAGECSLDTKDCSAQQWIFLIKKKDIPIVYDELLKLPTGYISKIWTFQERKTEKCRCSDADDMKLSLFFYFDVEDGTSKLYYNLCQACGSFSINTSLYYKI